MNSKMRTNSQLSKTEPKKQTKQTTRTGTESQKWKSYGGLSLGRGRGGGRMGGKDTGNKSIIGKHKIDMGTLRIV